MRMLAINGSARRGGNTDLILQEILAGQPSWAPKPKRSM